MQLRRDMKWGALILAAGSSSRLGVPKQLLRLEGETLLDRSIRIASEAGCAPIVVVLGAYEEQIRKECQLKGTLTVSHSNWSEGMGTSLSRGISELPDLSGVVIMTCDMPAVSADHLRLLVHSGSLTCSYYDGRNGVPGFFPSRFFSALLNLKGDSGAKSLLETAERIPLPGGELDIDTPDDLAIIQRLSPKSNQRCDTSS